MLAEARSVATSFAAAVTAGAANPTALVGMAAALLPRDSETTYGRYGAGSASVMLPAGTTVASLQAQLATQRAALALAAAGTAQTAASYSAGTDMLGALAALVEAMRAGHDRPGGPGACAAPPRGASLPSVATVVLGLPMPALAIAQRLYRDASRADEIIVEAGAPHPAFCPVSFKVLTSGLGANKAPTIPAADAARATLFTTIS